MANKTIDRKKAVPARSQAAKASPKNAPIKASRPAGNTPAKSATLTPEKSVTEAEVLEAEELEIEEPVDEADERDESDEEEPIEDESDEVVEEEEEEEEEEEVIEKPAKTRSKGKKDRDLVVSPQDYNVIRPTRRLPNFPGSKFLYSSYRELRLVTWPSRHDVWTWSLVVVGVSLAIAVLLGLADFGLSKFVTWWLSLAH